MRASTPVVALWRLGVHAGKHGGCDDHAAIKGMPLVASNHYSV
jgi:hypothetical protein